MPASAHAAATAAEHPEPHSAAAGALPRGGGLTIKVPLRLVVGAQYADAALSVYVKIAALALRPELCTAKVATLAEYLGMSKSGVERALKELTRPDEVDGMVEIPTRRRTYKDGRGQSAERYARPLDRGELWVRIPVRAAEALSPRLLRLYALLAYATARRIPVTLAELGEMLRHHTGQRAGEHLGERQVSRLVDELDVSGWLTVRRREGDRGRHAYETNRRPLHAVTPDGQCRSEAPVIHDGSGPADHDGSLASKEDLQTGRLEKTTLGGGIRRRRTSGTALRPVETVENPVPETFTGPGALRADNHATSKSRRQTGQLSDEQWTHVRAVLAPVAHLTSELSAWEQRRAAALIVEQLGEGATVERLYDRVERRYARTTTILSFGRWLIGAALVRRGCGDPRCETGTIWETGLDCELCAVNAQVAAEHARREQELGAAEQRAAASRYDRLREAERLAAEQARAAGRERSVLLAELAATDQVLPVAAVFGPRTPEPELAPAMPLPPKLSYRERTAAPDGEIRAAITAIGPAYALHVYGALRVLPLLDQAGRQAAAEPPNIPAAGQVREFAEQARGAIRGVPVGVLAAACPTCRALPNQPCTTPRGRRRSNPCEARIDAVPTSAHAAASGEDT